MGENDKKIQGENKEHESVQFKNTDPFPQSQANCLSYLTFHWLNKFMWKVYKNETVDRDNIWKFPESDSSYLNSKRFSALWEAEVKARGLEKASVGRVLWRFIQRRVIISTLVQMITLTFSFIGPTFLVKALLDYASKEEGELWYGLILVISMFVSELIKCVSFAMQWQLNYQTAVRTRGAVLAVLFHKVLRLRTLKDKSVGQVVNLCANDGQRIVEAISIGPLVIGGPLLGIAVTIYCVCVLSWWALLGALIFFLFYPYQVLISRLTTVLRRKAVVVTDKRVRLMNEILNCIKLIKFYAWEKSFAKSVSKIRGTERGYLEKAAYLHTMSVAFTPMVPVFAAVFTFIGHTLTGNTLDAAQVFVVLGAFTSKRIFDGNSFYAILQFSQFSVTTQRIKEIMVMEEIQPIKHDVTNENNAIEIYNATFGWDIQKSGDDTKKKDSNGKGQENGAKQNGKHLANGDAEHNGELDKLKDGDNENGEDYVEVLREINVEVPKGKIYGVCGSVGSGKSSLVAAILNQMTLLKGSCNVSGSIAYVPQQSWVMNTTLRENILFGMPFDEHKYRHVIEECDLQQDLEVLPAGDKTEIGERGINLSGGQKQRVSLARAVYNDRDIYLLDDPLSAVDPYVGQKLFERCLKGALADKTVLFVTHQLQYLKECDHVYLMKSGRIYEEGTHETLLQHNGEYAALIHKFHSEEQDKPKPLECHPKHPILGSLQKPHALSVASLVASKTSLLSASTTSIVSEKEILEVNGHLIEKEEVEQGAVSAKTYLTYGRATGGVIMSIVVLVSFILPVAAAAFSNWWLSYWINQGDGNYTLVDNTTLVPGTDVSEHPNLYTYAGIYASTVVAVVIFMCIRGFLFMKATLRASTTLHNKVFAKILRSPMQFFDTTPVGRILNRFAKDMDEIDVRLPIRAETFIQNAFLVLASLVIISCVFPYMLLAVLPLSIVFGLLYKLFRVVLRELKRADNVSRSPWISHITTTVQGLHTIHAFNKDQEFMDKFHKLTDHNSMMYLLFCYCTRWLSLRLDLITVTITTITTLFVVLTKGLVPVSYGGLAIAYASALTGLFQFTIRMACETEAHFSSVERIHHYITNVSTEAPAVTEDKRPPATWPKEGAISYHKYKMKYRSGLPLVLKGINCDIKPKEKIGIVGRTGSGKSSLGVALFRLVEPVSGHITIDGVDVMSIGLEDLRVKLSIIPQDPVLFVGTIRYNLDPFEEYKDEELWRALEKCHVKEVIQNVEGQLEAPVVENGENFSVGERQLICMARALLRNSKILMMDEATAAIDTETDAKIQDTIKEAFQECTMLTIAHRLNTVVNCDRVLVMDDGKIVEFDSPNKLLANPKSHFSGMMAATGLKDKKNTDDVEDDKAESYS